MALIYLIDTSVLKRLGQPLVRAAVEPLTGLELQTPGRYLTNFGAS